MTFSQPGTLADFKYSRTSFRLKVEDDNAFYCSGCNKVYGTGCPKCGATNTPGPKSEQAVARHRYAEPIDIPRPLDIEVNEFGRWIAVECHECRFPFRVLYR